MRSLRFGTGLQKKQPILLGELLGLLERHVTLALQVALVADQVNSRVRVSEASGVREPRAQVIVCTSASYVVDHEGARSAPVIAASDGSETLLSSCVPLRRVHATHKL